MPLIKFKIMTPKEKARELINVFFLPLEESLNANVNGKRKKIAKRHAKITVNEILSFSQKLGAKLYQEVGTESYSSRCENANMASYWKEVKEEIDKL